MGETLRQDRAVAESALVRRYAFKLGLKLLFGGLADFILLAILGPNLVDRHEDLALIGAIACLVAAVAVTIWLGLQLWRDAQAFAEARRKLRAGPSLKVIGS